MTTLRFAPLLFAIMLTGCSKTMEKVLEEPKLSPVPAGVDHTVDLPEDTSPQVPTRASWIGGPADYFRDERAQQVGDLVTVNIEIDDKANFNSSSERSRGSKMSNDGSFDMGILGVVGSGKGQLGIGSDSSMTGEGTIQRSEKLSIALAATVRRVLPNGHLVILGSQEVLVNAEKRVVTIEGIVDPKDVTRGNAVAYDRIAEARIYYGGSGQSSDVQSPRWGQRIWDQVTPF
jgi:flagellar L-ring protein FlgH